MKPYGFAKNLHSHVSVNADHAELARRAAGNVDDFTYRLAAEIVIRAVEDWRSLLKAQKWDEENPNPRCNFHELRRFFKSEWCDLLMLNFDIEPERLLELLEAELNKAQLQAAKEQTNRIKKGGRA